LQFYLKRGTLMKKLILGTSLLATSLFAEGNFATNGDLGLKLGTLGIGVEYSMPYSENLGIRLGVNKYSYGMDGKESDIDYNIDLDLQTFALIADYRPFSNGFIVSAGLMYNQNELTFDAKPTGANYTINNNTYTSAQVGSLDGTVDFNDIAPYIGMGYKGKMTQSGDWSFTAELGALYQGNPKANLNVNCGAAVPAAVCTALRNDVNDEQDELQDAIDGFNWYPVLSIGFSYKF
jgi:hypothetical protein